MDYIQFILTVNSSCITILLVLAFILLAATRFKGENGLAAAIIVIPNIPIYLYNMSRMLGWHGMTMLMFPLGFSVNTMLLPLLWLFTVKNYRPDFRYKASQLLHFLPAAVFLAICLAMPEQDRMDTIVHEMSGEDTWLGLINTIALLIQQFTYFPLIFRFIYKRKREIMNSSSNAEWIQKEWIAHLMILFAALFVTVMTCYVIWPRTDAWLIQILNVIAMSFLVYNAIAHPMLPAVPQESVIHQESVPQLSEEQMKDICDRAAAHLLSTKTYLDPDMSIAMLAKDTAIPQRNLSRSINTYLKLNFFEFINGMRVEEAKRKLMDLETSGYTIDSIFEDCGFRSRSTFFMVFKKMEGKTPAAWLKDQSSPNV